MTMSPWEGCRLIVSLEIPGKDKYISRQMILPADQVKRLENFAPPSGLKKLKETGNKSYFEWQRNREMAVRTVEIISQEIAYSIANYFSAECKEES